jgi:ArsR family transcriptional regulator
MSTTGDEACLCELVDSLLEPEYKLSRHVKVLKNSGFLTARKDGRWVYHRLVSGIPYLDALYETIRHLPDTDGAFKKDLGNFKKRLKLREDGRCQIGIQSKDLLDKAKS